MCGIAGFSLLNALNEKDKILKIMNDKLSHRGPDGEGFYHDNDVSFSHKRLAIIDLDSRSNQPFVDKTNQYVVIFNGEIYNYIELKKILIDAGLKFFTTSDTEVLLNSYIYWKEELLHKVKGMFAFAIYDKNKKQIFCSRDHFGQKPFFYYFKDGNFIFSSELTSLISNPIIKKELCIKSIANYLHYDSFTGDTTPLNNCYKLPSSEYLIFKIKERKIIKKSYWNINITKEKTYIDNYEDEFINKLITSTKLHLRSDVPIALYLSGGIDSSTLAYISKKILQNNNLSAFNLKFKNETFNENLLAADTANKLGLKLTTFNIEDTDFISELSDNINRIDEPLADVGFIAVSFISNFVSKEGYKVSLGGDGGDELLMGYEPFQRYWLYKLLNSFDPLSKSVKYISSLIPDSYNYMGLSYKMKIFSKALGVPKLNANSRWICSFLPEEIDRILKDQNLSNSEVYKYIYSIVESIDSNDDYDQLSIQYQKHFLTNLICNHSDKANMLYSIEARSPFLDPDLFNYTNNLPKDVKLKGSRSKMILRNYLKNTLKNSTYNFRKKGFTVPMAQWIKNELKNLILDTLNKDTLKNVGFLNYDYLIKKVIKPHMENKSNNHKKIWNIFVLINWLKNNQLA